MPIAINRASTSAIAATNRLGDYPNMVVVDFGRPRFDYHPISMRDLIQWTAYRLDCDEGNHRTAVILRAIAEQYYPNCDDQADWVIEELQDRGVEVDCDFDEAPPPAADRRLLGLVEGFAICTETFDEPLWEGQAPTPALARNASNYLDFEFPEEALERFGIRGIRVYALDLIHWAQSSIELDEMAYQDEGVWLDAWECSSDRRIANAKHRSQIRIRARHGDHGVDGAFDASTRGITGPAEQDAILAELDVLI